MKYLKEVFLSDTQMQMRKIIRTTQRVLHDITENNLYDTSLFEPGVHLDNNRVDDWFGFQLTYFWLDLIPKINRIWKRDSMITEDGNAMIQFPFSQREVMWAFSNYSDAYGPVLKRQRIMFRRCACVEQVDGVDENGRNVKVDRRKPCVPPEMGYMCYRECLLIKANIIREKDKVDRRVERHTRV